MSPIWLTVLGLSALVLGASATGSKCSALPELYYANVMGAIDGGVNTITVGDQSPCAMRSYVDLRYRQIDGRCNHPQDYGMTFKPVKRYLRPHYQDRYGENNPRIYSVVGGQYLPSPRLVSWKIHPDEKTKDKHTLLVMQLGQFLDHDITSAPVPTGQNSSIKCCGVPYADLPKECFPIPVPKDDPIFKDCIEFVRSESWFGDDGKMQLPREQINALTSYVDGSAIYGSDQETLNLLRAEDGKGILLKTRMVYGKERLPADPHAPASECTSSQQPDSYCQAAGDIRVNEQPALGSIHTLFHLHHNRLARQLVAGILQKRHQPTTPQIIEKFIQEAPEYLKEKIFQETRKIMGGILQKITYCDWLPVIVGPHLIEKFKLGCKRRSKYNKYVDPRVANVFLTCAFRFGHTLIPNKMNLGDRSEDLKDMFMIPDKNLRHYEGLVKSLVTEGEGEGFDRFFSKSITEHLFESSKGRKGALDLISVNTQRGRDHGLPGYYYWRQFYGLKPLRRLEDFGDGSDQMKSVYRHVLDIDCFTGGVMEKPVPGGLTGETFAHIIAHQFADLKYGDSHFFLSKEVPQGFTDQQLKAILDYSMNNILCSNSDLTEVQENPFYITKDENPLRPCSDYPDLDLTPWMIYF